MAKKSFLLVSLKENKAKELAQAISNESCRKILDYLAEKEDATETELSEKLQIPISTIHYNLKQLVAGSLVVADEYHYSKKGKEVNHYKLANKYIIIAPKTTYGIKEKLKSILPIALFALIGTGIIQLYTKYLKPAAFATMKAAPAALDQASEPQAAGAMMEAVAEEAPRALMGNVPEIATAAPNYALWFLFGCIFVIVLMVLFELIKAKREK